MALNLGDDVIFDGPALPEAFVRHELERQLGPALPKEKVAAPLWEAYRRALRQPLTGQSGRWRVKNVVLDPLAALLGYEVAAGGDAVVTREGPEGPGLVLRNGAVAVRAFPVDYQGDLDAPAERGQTYRFTPRRVAERILLAAGERVGLLTNGDDLRLLLSDPARPGTFVTFKLAAWRALSARDGVPDGFRLLLALLDPKLLAPQAGKDGEKPSKLQDILDAARLKQGQITKDLRTQARHAVEQFLQGVLDHPANRERFAAMTPAERERLPRQLWREGLILVYRLLFILRGESRGQFSIVASTVWRNTFSPTQALADVVRKVLDQGADTGHYLEGGLRKLFEIFEKGLSWKEARIEPLGGRLFGRQETPLLSDCAWDEIGCARLLDKLLWTLERTGGRGRRGGDQGPGRRRINYADLDVEDLGRVYEALLELEPGLATEPMVRLRRAKLEVVVPAAQGQKYRPAGAVAPTEAEDDTINGDAEEPEAESDDAEEGASGKKTKVEWIEEIRPRPGSPGTFYLRVGLGRKASGSYYTPESFVRFLVEETLRPQVDERSPKEDPQPREILKLKVLDPAMGSGHFLVGACRYLGERLYEACRACADRDLWDRIPADVAPYLPGRVQEGGAEVGTSAERAREICKRLVAIHCLYGVDRNALAVELARVCLWLEARVEGMPLTFLDHRLVHGDSLTGPDWFRLTYYPGKQERVQNLFAQGVQDQLQRRLTSVLQKVGRLQDTLGVNVYENQDKQRLKAEVDAELAPFHVLALIWSGGVMLGPDRCDDHGYAELLAHVSKHGTLPETLPEGVVRMLERGAGLDGLPGDRERLLDALAHQAERGEDTGRAISYDLTFPEVFFPTAAVFERKGFHAVLGNPPWEKLRVERRDIVAAIDPRFLSGRELAGVGDEHQVIESVFESNEAALDYEAEVASVKNVVQATLFGDLKRAGYNINLGNLDTYHLFAVKCHYVVHAEGSMGLLLGGGFAKSPMEEDLRRLFVDRTSIRYFAHYFNLKQIFLGASSRISFVAVVADKIQRADMPLGGYEFVDESALPRGTQPGAFHQLRPEAIVKCSYGDEESTATGTHLVRQDNDGEDSVKALEAMGIGISEGVHRTDNKEYIENLSRVLPGCEDARDPDIQEQLRHAGYACLYGGKSIDFFHSLPFAKSGKWSPQVDLVVSLDCPRVRSQSHALRFFRLTWRNTCGHIATNERSARACILPPGVVAVGSLMVEHSPNQRPNAKSLVAVAVINSFCFDRHVRRYVQTNFNKSILGRTVWPKVQGRAPLLSHCAFRLTCNHAGYAPLWREQLGEAWREPKPPFTWPVLETDDERWEVRAAIDAVVAHAYGLDRDQFAHVLSTFSHKSYPKAPALCLAKFDELKAIGLDAFTRQHDPYHDIPLVETLPQPVIELPGMADGGDAFTLDGSSGKRPKRGGKRR